MRASPKRKLRAHEQDHVRRVAQLVARLNLAAGDKGVIPLKGLSCNGRLRDDLVKPTRPTYRPPGSSASGWSTETWSITTFPSEKCPNT